MLVNQKYKVFPAKLLLFGEYTVLTGSQSLAVPFPLFSFHLTEKSDEQYKGLISSFYEYLKKIDFEVYGTSFLAEDFQNRMSRGLGFSSEIPIGYGLGSSGAFSAAIYDSFFHKAQNPELHQLKAIFSEIESFFHGKSSGVDPLIIYLNKALHFDSSGHISSFEFDKRKFRDYSFCLIDSGKKRSTVEYVSIFNGKIKNMDFDKEYIQPLIKINNSAIQHLLDKSQKADLFKFFDKISSIQYSAFPEMILPSIQNVWKDCLESKDHRMKLCGAGGGGFYYLLSKELGEFKNRFPELKLINIF